MKQIAEELQRIFSRHELQEDEYINEKDGLVYCMKCHTPRQGKYEFEGKIITPYFKCKCQQKEYNKIEEERKQHEFLSKISRMKASGLQEKALYDYNFANDSGINPEIRHAYTYVEKWEEMKKNATGLLIWGNVGTGKSFFAGCIANVLLEKGIPVQMTNFARILNTLTGMYSDDRNKFIEGVIKLMNKDILITKEMLLVWNVKNVEQQNIAKMDL